MIRRFQAAMRACAVSIALMGCASLLAVVASIIYYRNDAKETEYRPPEPHPRQPGSSRRVIARWARTYPPHESKADLDKWYDAIDDAGEGDRDQPAFVARVFLSYALSHGAAGIASRKAYTAGCVATEYFKSSQSLRAVVYFRWEPGDHVLLKFDPETTRWDVEEAWVDGSLLPMPEPDADAPARARSPDTGDCCRRDGACHSLFLRVSAFGRVAAREFSRGRQPTESVALHAV